LDDGSAGLFRPGNLELVSTDPHLTPRQIVNPVDQTVRPAPQVRPVEHAVDREACEGKPEHFVAGADPNTLLQEGRNVKLVALQSELGLTLNGKTGVLGKFCNGRWQVAFDDATSGIDPLLAYGKSFNAKNLQFLGLGTGPDASTISMLIISGQAYQRQGNGQVGPVAGMLMPLEQPAIAIYLPPGLSLLQGVHSTSYPYLS
jgi:hypothetical protein